MTHLWEKARLRRDRALAMREAGATMREIGKELGVSGARASQLVARARALMRRYELGQEHWTAGLSARAANCARLHYADRDELMSAAESGQLLQVPNVGITTAREILKWLGRGDLLRKQPYGKKLESPLARNRWMRKQYPFAKRAERILRDFGGGFNGLPTTKEEMLKLIEDGYSAGYAAATSKFYARMKRDEKRMESPESAEGECAT